MRDKPIQQDPAEGSRDIIDHELERQASSQTTLCSKSQALRQQNRHKRILAPRSAKSHSAAQAAQSANHCHNRGEFGYRTGNGAQGGGGWRQAHAGSAKRRRVGAHLPRD